MLHDNFVCAQDRSLSGVIWPNQYYYVVEIDLDWLTAYASKITNLESVQTWPWNLNCGLDDWFRDGSFLLWHCIPLSYDHLAQIHACGACGLVSGTRRAFVRTPRSKPQTECRIHGLNQSVILETSYTSLIIIARDIKSDGQTR
jgi:hypothetical protein